MKIPQKEGVQGSAEVFIKAEKSYEPAVRFVFGDTLIVTDDKTAFNLSGQGFRTVTVDGDLYEVGGAFESGYYRAPIDFSTIIPSDTAIKSLDEAVGALQQHLTRRNDDINGFVEDIEKTRVEIARLSEATITLDREIVRLRRSVRRTKSNVKRVDHYISKISKEVEAEKAQMWVHRAETKLDRERDAKASK